MSIDSLTQDSIRLDAWRAVFQKTNRILAEQKVTVNIVNDAPMLGMDGVPAWSDGLDIYLNRDKVMEMLSVNDKLAAVLRLKGLNYHELCHVLYTPRMTDDLCRRLVKKVEDAGNQTWWYAFNALEDQRIETWFTSTYGASRRYFEATILEWIIKNGSPEAAVLIYGRKYLTPKIRVQAGRVFRKRYDKTLYDEFKTVIDEYLTLVLPNEGIKAMSLITKYVELLDKMRAIHGAPLPVLVIEDNGGAECPAHGHDNGVARKGRVMIKPAQRARDKAAEAIEDAIDADIAEEAARQEAEQQSGDGNGSGEGTESEQSQTGKASGSGNGSDQGDQSESASVSSSESVDEGGGGASDAGSADHSTKDVEDEMDSLVNEAYDDLDEVREDEWVREDVEDMLDAVKAVESNGRMDAQGSAARSGTRPATSAANMAVRRVHDILSRIRQEAEPETMWRQQHGRVDARRIVQRQPHETDIFKTWDVGNEEETGVEAVVLVDVSGSMQGALPQAAEATWALKRAFDKLDIRTTVLLFDTNHEVLFQPSEKANGGGIPVLRAGGGTDPTSALAQAERILTKSQSPNKVLITVTDGSWGGDESQRLRQMKRLHGMGVVSMLLGLGSARSRFGKHGHLEGHDIKSIQELPKAALKMVAQIMRNAVYV